MWSNPDHNYPPVGAMDSDVAARTIRLLVLLQTRPTWPAAELAERLEVSPRSLRRDLTRLTDLGYAVESRPGPGGHYRLAAGSRIPPLLFDDDEVLAIVAGLRMAEPRLSGDAAARALVKLIRVLPPTLSEVAEKLADHSQALPRHAEPDPMPDVLKHLIDASAAGLSVAFDYTDQHGIPTQRHVDSTHLLFWGAAWYVLAFDLGRQDWRVFRLDRVDHVLAGSACPEREVPAADLADWLSRDFGRRLR